MGGFLGRLGTEAERNPELESYWRKVLLNSGIVNQFISHEQVPEEP